MSESDDNSSASTAMESHRSSTSEELIATLHSTEELNGLTLEDLRRSKMWAPSDLSEWRVDFRPRSAATSPTFLDLKP